MTDTRDIILLDPYARAGRTGHRLNVTEAKRHRADARHALGISRDDAPTTEDIIRAAHHLNVLLYDATEGDARLVVEFLEDGSTHRPMPVLATFRET